MLISSKQCQTYRDEITAWLCWKLSLFVVGNTSAGCGDIGYPSKTHLETQIWAHFTHTHHPVFSCPIILKFCTEHGSDTTMLCAKLQNDGARKMYVLDECNFTRCGSNTGFGWISYTTLLNQLILSSQWQWDINAGWQDFQQSDKNFQAAQSLFP